MTKKSKKVWYNIGSPPPDGLKNELLKFLSVNNIVIPAASTGRDDNNKTAVINTDQTNKGKALNLNPGNLKFITVAIKLIAPNIEEIPDKCKLKIAKSTEQSEVIADRGG
jgi:hypothetical protein